MQLKLSTSVLSSYRNMAIVFLVMTVVLTVVRGIYHDIFKDDYLRYLGPSFAPFGILFLITVVRLIQNLGVGEKFVRFVLVLLIGAVVLRALTILILKDPGIQFAFNVMSSSMLLVMQVVCVYFMCVNLFLENNPIKEKLWASVCVYFMLGACFGTIYSLITIIDADALGVTLSNPAEVYILGLVYSFNVISGLDPVYENASETIRMTAVLESIFSMLFMVILIGRLLGGKD